MELITLKVFDSPIEAHILRSKLESEDIESFVFDEHSVGINMLYAQAIGGVKLKIRETDSERALSVLEEINNTKYRKNKYVSCWKYKSDCFSYYFHNTESWNSTSKNKSTT